MKTRTTFKIKALLIAVAMLIGIVALFSLTVDAAEGNPCRATGCDGAYDNGFCNKCDAFEAPEIDEDGYCTIDNAGKLYN
jgi:hypothetical protein